jgi:hypothetical protein
MTVRRGTRSPTSCRNIAELGASIDGRCGGSPGEDWRRDCLAIVCDLMAIDFIMSVA